MSLPAIADDVIERVVLMAIHSIPQGQIAEAVGLSDGRISQIMDTAEYKERFSKELVQVVEAQQALNSGWDAIETQSISKLIDILDYNANPDFLLRVAAVSNRAVRRGDGGIKPVNGDAGARAVIHLTQNFIQKIQAFSDGQEIVAVENIPQKQEDFLAPDNVDKLLQPEKKSSMSKLLDGFEVQKNA